MLKRLVLVLAAAYAASVTRTLASAKLVAWPGLANPEESEATGARRGVRAQCLDVGDAKDPLGIAGSVVGVIGVLVIFLVSFVEDAETPDPTNGASRRFHGHSDETWPVGQWVVWKHSEHSNSD